MVQAPAPTREATLRGMSDEGWNIFEVWHSKALAQALSVFTKGQPNDNHQPAPNITDSAQPGTQIQVFKKGKGAVQVYAITREQAQQIA